MRCGEMPGGTAVVGGGAGGAGAAGVPVAGVVAAAGSSSGGTAGAGGAYCGIDKPQRFDLLRQRRDAHVVLRHAFAHHAQIAGELIDLQVLIGKRLALRRRLLVEAAVDAS